MEDLAPPESAKMDFSCDYKKADNNKTAYKLVKSAINPELISQYKIDVTFNYQEDKRIDARGSGFKMIIDFKDTHCEVSLDLTFPLKLLKPQIMGPIKEKIGRII
ncbi:MAG: hypothetical protein OXB84_09150 [Halobacteriovoraceae bacterium]|nr:hypothetical protein [Halobacteriovoraceae bacterium]